MEWDLSAHAGKMGRLEIVDGDDGASYAWIGVSPFTPPVVELPTLDPRSGIETQLRVAKLAGRYRIRSQEQTMISWLKGKNPNPAVRVEALFR